MNSIRDVEERISNIAKERPPDGLVELAHYFDEFEDGMGGEHLPTWSIAAMLAYGRPGVAFAVEKYRGAKKVRGHVAVLAVCYSAGTSTVGDASTDEELLHSLSVLNVPLHLLADLDPDTRSAAMTAFREFVLSMTQHPDENLYLSQLIMTDAFHPVSFGGPGVVRAVSDALRDVTIAISPEILADFRSLIDRELREEEYQQFLAQRPVLLDPLAAKVVPQHRLGAEFVADYVIASLADRHTVVEIEKPQDPVFTAGGNYSSQLTHALRQVLDSQDWIEHNIAYARERLPKIASPSGLVVIGRSTGWTDAEHRRLRRLNISLGGRVRIATYDDILQDGERLYANILQGRT